VPTATPIVTPTNTTPTSAIAPFFASAQADDWRLCTQQGQRCVAVVLWSSDESFTEVRGRTTTNRVLFID